jgi:hypothetical protein
LDYQTFYLPHLQHRSFQLLQHTTQLNTLVMQITANLSTSQWMSVWGITMGGSNTCRACWWDRARYMSLWIRRTKMEGQDYTNINTKSIILPLNTISWSIPSLGSIIQRIRPGPRLFNDFPNKLIFLPWRVVSPISVTMARTLGRKWRYWFHASVFVL